MCSDDELARVTRDPVIRRLAMRRAGSRELAEDALQETYWSVAHKDLETIDDLRAYFIRALVREIDHQRMRFGPIPVGDLTSVVESGPTSTAHNPLDSVERQAEMHRLARTVLERMNREGEELMATVPRRSSDGRLYRAGIVAAAQTIFLLLLKGTVTNSDENAVLRSVYLPWFGESGLSADASDQRFSRGRRDVRCVLKRLVTRDELI